jgi:hypothetical protein
LRFPPSELTCSREHVPGGERRELPHPQRRASHSTLQQCNGKNLDGRTRQAVITALANGEPISRIARRLRVGHNTISAIQQIEWAEVSKRKELVPARAARLAAAGFDKLNEEMDAGNIKGALLVPVTGMAIDKVIALSGKRSTRRNSKRSDGHENIMRKRFWN